MGDKQNNLVVEKLKEVFPEYSGEILSHHLQANLRSLGPDILIGFDALLTLCVDSLLCNPPPSGASFDKEGSSKANSDKNPPDQLGVARSQQNSISDPQQGFQSQDDASGLHRRGSSGKCSTLPPDRRNTDPTTVAHLIGSTISNQNEDIHKGSDNKAASHYSFAMPAVLDGRGSHRGRESSDSDVSSHSSESSISFSSSGDEEIQRITEGRNDIPIVRGNTIVRGEQHVSLNTGYRQPRAELIDLSSSSTEHTSTSDDTRSDEDSTSNSDPHTPPFHGEEVIIEEDPVPQLDQGRGHVLQDQAKIVNDGVDFKQKVKTPLEVVLSVVPDVDEKYAEEMLSGYINYPPDMITTMVCSQLLDAKNYPKRQIEETEEKKDAPSNKSDRSYEDYSKTVSIPYADQVRTMLANEFPFVPHLNIENQYASTEKTEHFLLFVANNVDYQISQADLTKFLRKFNYHYIPTVKWVEKLLCDMKKEPEQIIEFHARELFNIVHCQTDYRIETKWKSISVINFPLFSKTIYKFHIDILTGRSPFVMLKRPRSKRPIPFKLDTALEEDIQYLKQSRQADAEREDHVLALKLNNEEYEKEGQLIECGCCFGEYPFEDMVQCVEGHLFCAECLRRYAEEAVFGSSKSALACMTDGCTESFLKSHLQKCLPDKIMVKYEEREQEEALKLAGLKDLVRCPGCDYAAEIPPEQKVLQCQNPSCRKETCRHCKADWSEHFGIPCKEVEGKSQKNLRISYEEKMTKAKIRICPTCNCGFMKTDGCNKMTCRCGTTMCYICRTAKIGYNHFCNHLREPGHSCTNCSRCSLWTDPTEDDERAVREIKKEAKLHQKRLADENNVQLTSNTDIGPSLSPPPKKRHRHGHHF